MSSTTFAALAETRAHERSSDAIVATKTQLREAIAKLIEARTLFDAKIWSSRTSVTGPLARAVEQYYLMFGNGLVVPGKDSPAAVHEAHDMQLGFLQNYMDEDVRYGDDTGRMMVYEQWRRYAVIHKAMGVAVTSVEVSDTGDENRLEIVAKGVLKLNLDRATVQFVFPQILSDEVLVQQLIGNEMVYDTLTTYVFNAAGQVVTQDLAVDFMSGFRKMLGDDVVAAKLLEESRIDKFAKIHLSEDEP